MSIDSVYFSGPINLMRIDTSVSCDSIKLTDQLDDGEMLEGASRSNDLGGSRSMFLIEWG